MPSARIYDTVAGLALRAFYGWVAADSAPFARAGRVLDVGTGPGHLVASLARLVPDAQIHGVDVLLAMLERGNALVTRNGLADRTSFTVADVAELPFADGQFDLVLSTLSLHHWADPARGLVEIRRVLIPGRTARIYDVADWITRLETRGPRLRELIAASPFDRGEVETVAGIGPLPLLVRASLTRAGSEGND